jgi:hypothetical protein
MEWELPPKIILGKFVISSSFTPFENKPLKGLVGGENMVCFMTQMAGIWLLEHGPGSGQCGSVWGVVGGRQ